MQRINSDGSVAGHFVPADASLGQVATEVTSPWLNSVQDEIANVVEGAGISLNPADDGQMLQAIRVLLGNGATRNPLINGDFRLWQRGNNINITTGTARYTADRWRVDPGSGNSNTLNLQDYGPFPGIAGIPGDAAHGIKWTQNSQLNGATNPTLGQRIENAFTFNGTVVVLSFCAITNTAQTTTVTPSLRQYFGSGGSSDVSTAGTAKTITDVWTRQTHVFNVPATLGKTFGSGHYLELLLEIPKTYASWIAITDVQIEVGTAPTNFERLPDSFNEILCRRFFEKSYMLHQAPGFASVYDGMSMAYAAGANVLGLNTRFKVTKTLAVPVVITWYAFDGTSGSILYNGANRTVSSTSGEGPDGTGFPITASQAASEAYAHWTAESEL